MEAINSLGINWKLFLAQVINFLILLLLLRIFLYKPILNTLETRKHKIEKGLSDSEKAQKILVENEAEAKRITERAVKESEKIIASSKKFAEGESQKILKQAQEKSKKIIIEASEEAQMKKNSALKEAKDDLLDLVVASTEKVLGQREDSQNIKKSIAKL